jgi:hypothetical protein
LSFGGLACLQLLVRALSATRLNLGLPSLKLSQRRLNRVVFCDLGRLAFTLRCLAPLLGCRFLLLLVLNPPSLRLGGLTYMPLIFLALTLSCQLLLLHRFLLLVYAPGLRLGGPASTCLVRLELSTTRTRLHLGKPHLELREDFGFSLHQMRE